MASSNDSSDRKNGQDKKQRAELFEKIQTLEWSLAQKNRENKQLKQDIEDCKQEVADLQGQVDKLSGNEDSNSEGSSTG